MRPFCWYMGLQGFNEVLKPTSYRIVEPPVNIKNLGPPEVADHTMAGWNFQKLIVALCTPGIRCHKKCRPMSVRYNFTVQITREKHLTHGNNAIANFLCCSGYQCDPKCLINLSLLLQCKQGFGSCNRRGLASFWALWSTCAMNNTSNINRGLPTTSWCSVTSGLQSQSHYNSMGMISIMNCKKIQHWS